jgi:hypothetical protein
MKIAATYIANDGSRFDSEEACKEHETLVDKISKIMSPLGEKGKIGTDEYIQHDLEVCFRVKDALYDLAKRTLNPKNNSTYLALKHNTNNREIHPLSVIGRILDDSSSVLSRANNRLMSIDWETGREYQQPYFAMNNRKCEAEGQKFTRKDQE